MKYRSLGSAASPLSLLAFPPPYKAWLSICSDPDATDLKAWQALKETIWDELELPFEDSFFISTHNEHLPDQVSLESHPDTAEGHPYDTMHTWGDYMYSRGPAFTRDTARQGLARLQGLGISPKVWTDHDCFSGNMRHNSTRGGTKVFHDASGYRDEVFEYSLDLAMEAGVRYVWDGEVTHILGQDRPLDRAEWYGGLFAAPWKARLFGRLDALGRPLWNYVKSALFDYDEAANQQYFPFTFPDGNTLYCFRRYGQWELADIDGLGELLAPNAIDSLIKDHGSCIAYTHWGKRRADRLDDENHIPAQTLTAFEHIRDRYREGDLMVSGTARLLDYLVLRDHAEIRESSINFRPDGIRFETLKPDDLAGFTFGFSSTLMIKPTILCDGEAIEAEVDKECPVFGTIRFAEASP